MYPNGSSSIFQAVKTGCRRHYVSSVERRNALNYLRTWVGKSGSTSTNPIPKTSGKGANLSLNTRSGLTVSGALYLLPTLRLERSETPNSLSTRLESFFDNAGASSAAIRALLLPKDLTTTNSEGVQKSSFLKVPVILDMKAFQHDGSPHYKAPAEGSLKRFVKVLSDWGITVLGLTNISASRTAANGLYHHDTSGGDRHATELEREAMRLGLPVLMSRAGRTLGGSSNADDKFGTKSVVESLQLEDILLRNVESPSDNSDLDKTVEASTNHEGSIPIPVGSKVFHGSVRTGQQVSTDKPNQSLVIIGNVNSGGEVMADCDLYIFGKLKGRALAGLASNLNPQMSPSIFASTFDPELICIGEIFSTIDSVKELGIKNGAMVSLNHNQELTFKGF